jgi:hypothetical protein
MIKSRRSGPDLILLLPQARSSVLFIPDDKRPEQAYLSVRESKHIVSQGQNMGHGTARAGISSRIAKFWAR